MAIFGALSTIIWIAAAVWVIYDIVKNQTVKKDTEKIIWIVCALLFSVITAIVYYFVIKNKK